MILDRSSSKRQVVNHSYHDHALDQNLDIVSDDTGSSDDEVRAVKKKKRRGPRGGVAVPFPIKLHKMLEEADREDGHSHIVSWQPHGRCFLLHKPKEFVSKVMPKYFKQSKLTSFQRQLNLYGFNRLTSGPDRGAYYHCLFLRGKDFLCKKMSRTRVKGTGFKAASSPDTEPNFYYMPPLPESPFASNKDKTNDNAPPRRGKTRDRFTNKKKTPTPRKNSNEVKKENIAHVVWPDESGIVTCSSNDDSFLPGITKAPQNIRPEATPDQVVSSAPPVPVTPSLSPEVALTGEEMVPSDWMLNDSDQVPSGPPVPVTPSMSPEATFSGEGLVPSNWILNDPHCPPPPPFGEDDEEQDCDQMYFEGKQFYYIDSDFCEHRKQPVSDNMFMTGGGDIPSLPMNDEFAHDETLVDMIMG